MEKNTDAKNAALDSMKINARMIAKAQEEQAIFVGMAREAGASWAEVGTALGLTKQAAQQRYGKAEARTKASRTVAANLAGQTSITVDAPQPAKAQDEPTDDTDYETGSVIETAVIRDRAGHVVDMSRPMEERPKRCPYCFSNGHTKTGEVWIYQGCTPTQSDPVTGPKPEETDHWELYENPREGGSLTGKGFDCRFCTFTADTSHHGPGDRMMHAARIGTDHMREEHDRTLDGKELDA